MEKVLTKNMRPGEPMEIDEYERAGGYQGLKRALKMAPLEVQELVGRVNLRGRGGAGFPAGKKWALVPMEQAARRPKYLCINADEMEPGTMKDRLLMEGDPHQLIEGAITSAYAIQADCCYIFLRWAYKLSARRLAKAIDEAYAHRYLGKNIQNSGYSLEMRLHTSAGRYMCGEASAMLDAVQGKRATPRSRPPHAEVCGLWGKPTVVQNVETICCVHHIVRNGPEWFMKLSKTEEGGTKIYGCSGRVNNPGVWELPMGTPVRDILFEHAGGMQSGYQFKGLLPGGASSNFIRQEHLDTPMDFSHMEAVGSRLGTGTMVVMDDRICPVGVQLSLQEFFARESCGWCTPCREGLPWIARALRAIEEGTGQAQDMDVLDLNAKHIRLGNTFCALAPGAMFPLESALRFWREDFLEHVRQKRCPWKE